MAVTLFNANATSGPASAGSRTLLHTGTNGASLLVWIHSNEATTYSAVAAGVRPLTRLTAVSAGTSRLELWGLTTVPSGVLTISAIPAGTQVATWAMAAATYVGRGNNPFGTPVGGTATTATLDISVSSTTTDIVAFGFGISANTTLVVNNGNTNASATLSTRGRLVIGDIAGATTVSVSATAGAGTPVWAWAAVPVVASTSKIRFDNAAQTGTSGASNSRGLLLTATADAVLIVCTNIPGPESVSAINIGSTQLTRLGAIDYRAEFGAHRAEMWGLTAPPSGVLTISAQLVGTTPGFWGMLAVTYTGHRTTDSPFGGVVTGSTSITGATSLVLSSSLTDLAIFSFACDEPGQSEGSTLIKRVITPFISVMLCDAVGAASITGSATCTPATVYGNIGINLIGSVDTVTTITGSISAVETFSDSFSASGYTLVRGRLSATDAANDTFSASGAVRVSGRLSATESIADTFSASGRVIVRGRLSATEAFTDTFSASGQVIVRGRLSATEAFTDTFSASGYVVVRGLLSATDAPDVFVASATVVSQNISGRLSATEAFSDAFSASGYTVVTGRLSATDALDSFSASGYVVVQGRLSATDAPDTFIALGSGVTGTTTGQLSATDAPDTFSASAYVIVTGRLSATDAPDIFLATGPLVDRRDTGAGGGKRKNDDYTPANDLYWEARERYLLSLQPEIAGDDLPQIFPEPNGTVEPATVPLLIAELRFERREALTAIDHARNMRQLRAAGKRLRLINQRLREELASAQLELARIQYLIDEPRRRRAAKMSRLRKQLVLLEMARSILQLQDHL